MSSNYTPFETWFMDGQYCVSRTKMLPMRVFQVLVVLTIFSSPFYFGYLGLIFQAYFALWFTLVPGAGYIYLGNNSVTECDCEFTPAPGDNYCMNCGARLDSPR